MVDRIERIKTLFPKLANAPFQITSPPDRTYNCIAWTAGVTNVRWWPLEDAEDAHWPDAVARVETVEAFQAAFASLGYVVCPGEDLESGFEKVALFADSLGLPSHAARQLPSGRWTSKLGKAEDIEHDLRDLEGDIYGSVVLVMKRPFNIP
jgi:hypothetical protein